MFEYEAIKYRARDLQRQAEHERLVREVVKAGRTARAREEAKAAVPDVVAGQRRWRRAPAH
jgi:hypothetical protein